MANTPKETLVCQIIDEHTTVTMGQLCRSCGVHAEWVTVLVEQGVIEPTYGKGTQGWQFAATQLPRVHTAARLERDLGLNASGIALAIELMDEIRDLRQRLGTFDTE